MIAFDCPISPSIRRVYETSCVARHGQPEALVMGEDEMQAERCPDCHANPGQLHEWDCDVEQCPSCGGQLISCSCGDETPPDERMPWTGRWPGVAECREFGWHSKSVPGVGYVPCDAGDEGDAEDLNRLRKSARWDRLEKRFVRQGSPDPSGQDAEDGSIGMPAGLY